MPIEEPKIVQEIQQNDLLMEDMDLSDEDYVPSQDDSSEAEGDEGDEGEDDE